MDTPIVEMTLSPVDEKRIISSETAQYIGPKDFGGMSELRARQIVKINGYLFVVDNVIVDGERIQVDFEKIHKQA